MRLLTIVHGKGAYRADFAFYGLAVVLLAIYLVLAAPSGQRAALALLALAGMAAWPPIEYALHRFVLHGLEPFRRLHAEHHRRPQALICAPTLVSATLVGALVFLPALGLGGLWRACALTLGFLVGYLAYAITHHALHHWHAGGAWLRRRRRWHALHHRPGAAPDRFGVTSAVWDHLLGSAGHAPQARRGDAEDILRQAHVCRRGSVDER